MNNATTSDSPEAPAAVVSAFIAAMNEWERDSWTRSRQFRGTERAHEHWAEAGRTLALIHAAYLTPKRRVYAEQPTFQHPPAYDPGKESITAASVTGRKALVETTRTGVLGAGRYQYVLHCHESGWLIDGVQHFAEGQWKRAIL